MSAVFVGVVIVVLPYLYWRMFYRSNASVRPTRIPVHRGAKRPTKAQYRKAVSRRLSESVNVAYRR